MGIKSIILLLPKSKISSLWLYLLFLFSPVCLAPGQNPRVVYAFHQLLRNQTIIFLFAFFFFLPKFILEPIFSFQIRDLAKEKGIKTTDACSALNGDNVENVFENVIIKYFKSLERIRPHRVYCCWCHGLCTVI